MSTTTRLSVRATLVMLGLTVCVTVCLMGCAKTISDRDLQLVGVAEGIELVEARKKLLGGSRTGAWVDPRSERAYRQGHIPGAISLPYQYVASRHEELKPFDVLVVYGDDYNDDLADGMSKRLMELGFRDVRTLRGGLRTWKAAEYELETGDPASGATSPQ